MLDLAKVRALYFDLPLHDPERTPSREELYARFERGRFDDCLLRGGDPEAEGIGPHGSLIGGRSKPLTVFHVFPEVHGKLQPLPLAWFNHPAAHSPIIPPGGIEEAHLFFRSLSHAYLAGHRDRPSGSLLRHHFRSPELAGLALSHVWHVLAAMRSFDLHRFLTRSTVSLYEFVRAIHLTDVHRASVTRWVNQFAIRPTQ